MSTKYQKVPTKENSTNYREDLETTFNESLTEEEEEEEVSYRHITDSHGLLGIPSQSDNYCFVSTSSSNNDSKKPTPITNDGVFKNISTSQQQQQQHNDHPPSYSDATMDTTPPYWQTTIFESSSSSIDRNNIILVNGLPVGSLFIFFWNLLISACFQFVGFLLTYILYTSHAGKNGSRAGLGVSLVQLGFYIRGCSKLNFDFDFDFDFDNDQDDNDQEDDDDDDDDFKNIYLDIIAYFFMVLGWFIIIKSIADYLKAKKMEKIIKTDSIISESYTSSNNNNNIRMVNMERIV
ncbi:unnamed protein product [Cunninghamella echinulata]